MVIIRLLHVLANEAFKAAADPNRFPEQFKYVSSPGR